MYFCGNTTIFKVKNYSSSDFKLGVLGGGQLGRMLLAETQKLDIHTSILESNKKAPELLNQITHVHLTLRNLQHA